MARRLYLAAGLGVDVAIAIRRHRPLMALRLFAGKMLQMNPEILQPRDVIEPCRVRVFAVDVDAQRFARFDRDRRQLRVMDSRLANVLAALDLENEPGEIGTAHRLDDAKIQQTVRDTSVRRDERAAA